MYFYQVFISIRTILYCINSQVELYFLGLISFVLYFSSWGSLGSFWFIIGFQTRSEARRFSQMVCGSFRSNKRSSSSKRLL